MQVQLHAQDVIVCETHIDQGMKEANPMDTVLFYQTRDRDMGDKAFKMQPSDVSNMLGSVYQVSDAVWLCCCNFCTAETYSASAVGSGKLVDKAFLWR
jgi:hypothetical protein